MATSQVEKTQLVSFNRSNNSGAIGKNMEGSGLQEKTSSQILGLSFFSKLDCGFYTVSIVKTVSKKIGTLIHTKSFFFPSLSLSLQISIRRGTEYFCHVYADTSNCYLNMLDKQQKWV